VTTVARYLDASTAHLTPNDARLLRRLTDGILIGDCPPIAHATGFGWLVWVPHDCIDDYEHAYSACGFSIDFNGLLGVARDLGCRWILFDRDGDPVDGFTVYPH